MSVKAIIPLNTPETQFWPLQPQHFPRELEELVVEAKKLAIEPQDVAQALTQHWRRLDAPAILKRDRH